MHFAHPHLIHALLTWGPRLLVLLVACALTEVEVMALEGTSLAHEGMGTWAHAHMGTWHLDIYQQVDSPEIDLQYPITDPPAPGSNNTGTVDLAAPENVTNEVVYDPVTGQYIMQSTIGDNIQYRPPMSMSLDEYLNYDMQNSMKTYWSDKNKAAVERDANKPLIKSINVRSEAFCRIFRGCNIDIRPQGSAEVTFGLNISKTENPRIPVEQRKITTFNFDQRIQLNLVGNIGEALKINTAYNTEATFDFENQVKLNYVGDEDQIVQKLEAGNVSLPLSGQLIQGSQSLFGLKTELRFGRLTATAIFSQEKGQRKNVQVAGGAQTTNFDIKGDEYEANKYFFLSNYFRDNYENALRTLPLVNSGINITRIEVWITNTRFDFEQNRNAVAFTDLGEDGSAQAIAAGHFSANLPGEIVDLAGNIADNGANTLFGIMSAPSGPGGSFTNATSFLSSGGYIAAKHYEKLESARLLTASEYTLNERLGFIGLNQNLNNDEVLMVAYQYTLDGQTHQVGQFGSDVTDPSKALILRLLKATITDPRIPLWDLMMKNVYSLGAFQVNRENFRLDLVYNNPTTGVDINYIPRPPLATMPVNQALGLDRLDPQNAPNPDGWFDFLDGAATTGGTINTQNGRVFFPVLEPFGSYLDRRLLEDPSNTEQIRKNIVYQQLYDSTKTAAQNIPELNRFRLKGSYKSASSDVISLNSVNIPQGSVSVTAGGVKLQEGQDYTVDYNLGRVKILNQGILESGTPINISLESNSLFSIQQRTLAGARFDYKVNKDLTLGATVMNLYERPLTQKVNAGDEPISNTILGLDANWKTESNLITRMVDQLPFFATKEVSTVNASVEGAYLIPGHSRAIGNMGTSYIDDFEGSVSTIDMRQQAQWFHAATPQGQTEPGLWPEGALFDRDNGFRRAHLAWYVVDPIFFRDNSLKPTMPDGAELLNTTREILESEVFPNRQLPTGTPPNIPVLDLAYYPAERGPYNYTTNLTPEGYMVDPEGSWAGITRRITTTDFELSNIETIQFWMMDPFGPGGGGSNQDSQNSSGGDFYIDIGNISEDVLRDGRKSFENGLPSNENDQASETGETTWGVVPTTQSVVNAFAINDNNSYSRQDVGLDGLRDNAGNLAIPSEQDFQRNADYLAGINGIVTNNAARRDSMNQDPSGDRYHFFRGDDYDEGDGGQGFGILRRYKYFNGPEGNSISDEESPEEYPTQQTTLPSTEDINQDQNLAETESYFQYRVSLRPNDMVVGQNFITDRIEGRSKDGSRTVYWYQFKIPIRQPEKKVGGIQDFRSIRFMRLLMKGWQQESVIRLARLEFIRGEWRKYQQSLEAPGEGQGGDPDATQFNVAAVNVEENGRRVPINYVLPPGINKETDVASANLRNLNEQSLQLQVCNLRDGDSRAAFRNVQFDIRSYKKLRMFVHAETRDPAHPIAYGDVSVYIRLGNDFDQNYYEYEVPVKPSTFGDNDPYSVWPEDNDMTVEFAKLNDVKIERNQSGAVVNLRFTKFDGDRRITVKGNPNLSQMRTIMIGVRNPKKDGDEANPWAPDNGISQCAEVWVNELRLTDFDQSGGWAALARVNTTLADLGTLSVAGNYSTPFWGSIDKRVSERQRDTRYGVDVSANLEMGKFLPQESGVKVPLYVGYSEQIINPQFDPLNPDIQWDDATRALTREERKERLKQLRTYTRRRSINVTNVHKERGSGGGDKGGGGGGGSKEHFWDVENLSLSYAYGDQEYHDVTTAYENTRTYRGSLAWQHNPKPIAIKPFEGVGFIGKSKWTKLIKDFNVNLGFKQLTARTAIDRTYLERLVRANPDIEGLPPVPTYNKTFTWQTQYGFRYEITKALKVDFNANRNAIIGEPPGRVNAKDKPNYELWKDSVMQSIGKFGLPTQYDHTVNVTYTLPLDKLPITDWVTVNTTYGAGYKWDRAPLSQDSIGNTIQNSRTISINGQLNFVNLYNKIKYFKKINDKAKGGGKKPPAKGKDGGKDGKGKDDKKDEEKKDDTPKKIDPVAGLARVLMAIRTGTITYTQNNGTLLPGWNRGPNVIGMDKGFGAPGYGFVLGEQNTAFNGDIVRDFATKAAANDWLVKTESIFTPYTSNRTENITARLNVEPFKGFRIDLSANRTSTDNRSSFFRWRSDSLGNRYVNDSPRETGSFSVSMLNWPTTFARDDENFVNQLFTNLLAYRETISERLGRANQLSELPIGLPSDSTYWTGYGATSQDVVVPAFIAAYTGKDPNSVKLNPFKLLPAPNWDVTYDGLTKLEFFKKLFRTFTVNHSYRSTFSISSYQTNLFYQPGSDTTDVLGNYIPARQLTTVTISEVMRPFINFDATLQNSLLAKFEYNRDRNLSLSLTNNQITEVRGKEFVIGSGYRFKDVKFPFELGGKTPKSDLNLRVDLSWRQNNTVIRKIEQEQNTVTAGQDIISIKTSADYVIDQKLNVRAFYERVINKPVISTTFPSANTNLGISLRFTLTQ
ncbi:MAG: cell surface protein SprA [Flavobacteriales bacterium]|nr:cell surface protein SprA [Flavobacteriales bacterium]